MKFRKKPVVIEAEQWLGRDDLVQAGRVEAFLQQGNASFKVDGNSVFIDTLEGMMTASKGDWIIKGVQSEFYPCKPDIFEQTYELEHDSAASEREWVSVDGVYVASRASVPERGAMWREFRDRGVPITSSWIDEDGEGQTNDFGELWARIYVEIVVSGGLVLYAESDDFPLKGALIEAGIAIGLQKPITICLPNVELNPRSCRPIGSWINHPLVTRIDDIEQAMQPYAPNGETK